MQVESVDLKRLKSLEGVRTLGALQIGDSIFLTDLKKAQSLRALSYYFLKSRRLNWKFTFRKMDHGWRIIRVA
jgi:hypothetical protein